MKQEHYNKARLLKNNIDQLESMIGNARLEHTFIRIGPSELNANFYPKAFSDIKESILKIWQEDLEKKTKEFDEL